MERNRKTRIVAITSMLIAVVFLTIAYAVFSKNLNIQNMSATVRGNEANFSVKFSNSATKLDESDVTGSFSSGEGILLPAHIDNSGPNPKLTNLGVNISSDYPNDIYYILYTINDGGIDAYLKNIKIANVVGYDKPVVCIASEGTSQKLVDEACKHFRISIGVDNKGIAATSKGITHGDNSPYDNGLAGNYTGITGHKLDKAVNSNLSYHIVGLNFYLEYSEDFADGPYEIKIGDVTVEYSTQD